MANTYTKIASVTVGSGGAATMEFLSIPSTYTDLCVKVSGRTTITNADSMGLKLNGATSGNSSRWLAGTSTAVQSATDASSVIVVSYAGLPGTAATANTFSNIEFYIPNYAGSTTKSVSSDSVGENNSAAAFSANASILAGLQTSTSAITSLTLNVYTGGNFVQYSTATLYGISIGAKATGGIITSDANYFYHTFNASGTFTPTQSLTWDYLVVAGGGGGAGRFGGGGGAGGYRTSIGGSALSLTATPYTVTIGAGGAGTADAPPYPVGGDGNNSVFSTITSAGGGGAGSAGFAPNNGGSGGGAAGGTPGLGNTPSTSPSQGNNGGQGTGSSPFVGGGGGGASAVGSPRSGGTGGAGGAGTASSISGSSVTYAGGGGGGSYTGTGGAGGAGGGGAGTGSAANGGNGTVNTGGGAGGAGQGRTGGTGGSGIVIVRYAR